MKKSLQLKLYRLLIRLTPPFLLSKVLRLASTLRYLSYSKDKVKIISRSADLLKKKKNHKAYIMATGPSIKDMNIAEVEGADFFSVSNFFLHDEIKKINLVAHFFANYHEPLILQEYIDWLSSADTVLDDGTTICLSYDVKWLVDSHQIFEGKDVFYFSFEKELSLYGLNLSKPFQSPHTSPVFLLALTIAMGYEEVYLCGCDHTVLRDYKKNVANFYPHGKETRQNATGGKRWDSGIAAHLINLIDTIDQYEQLAAIAKERGITVKNLSSDSWLEMFDAD